MIYSEQRSTNPHRITAISLGLLPSADFRMEHSQIVGCLGHIKVYFTKQLTADVESFFFCFNRGLKSFYLVGLAFLRLENESRLIAVDAVGV